MSYHIAVSSNKFARFRRNEVADYSSSLKSVCHWLYNFITVHYI